MTAVDNRLQLQLISVRFSSGAQAQARTEGNNAAWNLLMQHLASRVLLLPVLGHMLHAVPRLRKTLSGYMSLAHDMSGLINM